jgi:hypothetical protein
LLLFWHGWSLLGVLVRLEATGIGVMVESVGLCLLSSSVIEPLLTLNSE